MKKHCAVGLLVVLTFTAGTAQAEGLFDKMLDRTVDSAERKARDRITSASTNPSTKQSIKRKRPCSASLLTRSV